MKSKTFLKILKLFGIVSAISVLTFSVTYTADVITNGAFDANITTGWTNMSSGSGTTSWDNSIGGIANGSMKGSVSGRNINHTAILSQSIGSIDATDDILLSFYWYKASTTASPSQNNMIVRIIKPSGDSTNIWTNTSIPTAGTPSSGTVTDMIVSSLFNETGIYTLRLYGYVASTNNRMTVHQLNFDDIVLDISTPAVNDPPIVTDIPDQLVSEGSNFTIINLDDHVSDLNNTDAEMNWTYSGNTELTVDITNRIATIIIPDINWNGSETITFRATDPGLLWDEDLATFTVTAVNDPPIIIASAPFASPATINKIGTNSTTIFSDFTDIEEPGVGAFTATFKVQEPDNFTEITLVNNQPNGGGGLTIIDNGGGSYTASYTWDPSDAQATGTYDLYFEVSDGTDNAIDGYTNNSDELDIYQQNSPTVVSGATSISISPVNRFGINTTIISTDFTDIDQPDVNAFTVSFKIREPNDITEVTLVNGQTNGNGGLTVVDNGGGSYTASYNYNPDDAQALGLYDLYFEVSDGVDNIVDDYANNLDELTIEEIFPPTAPAVTSGATAVTTSPVGRSGVETTTIYADFTDVNLHANTAFTVSIKVRNPNNITEEILVNSLTHGNGGLTITDYGGGSYRAEYDWDPATNQQLGFYDLFFEVNDGSFTTTDDYPNNLDELELVVSTSNNAPTVVSGATTVSVSPVNRYGSNSTIISTDFTDNDIPAVGSFYVTFKVREPDNSTELTLVNNLSHGTGGLTIVDNGGGSYTASYNYNPDDAQTLGLYDLYFEVSDGVDNISDGYTNNGDELEINESIPPTAPSIVSGAAYPSVSQVNRYGTVTTNITCDFNDINEHPTSTFFVTMKLREPNNTTELTLVNNLQDGAPGLSITDNGGGSYTASYDYNPDDAQTLGLYDLYFEVSDGSDNAIDDYTNNLDELEITESITNNIPVIIPGATVVSVSPVNRLGTDFTTISASFTDSDIPDISSLFITFKIRRPDNSTEDILVDNRPNGIAGLTITDHGGGSYTAQYNFYPGSTQPIGFYDLLTIVNDGTDQTTDDYVNNSDELEIVEVFTNNIPSITAGDTKTTKSPVSRIEGDTTTIYTSFYDSDIPPIGDFLITIKIRQPDNSTEITLLSTSTNGQNGLVITDQGGGVYTAFYNFDPNDSWQIGAYDLYVEVSDGIDNAIDGYTNNLDELEINNVNPNDAPTFTAGITSVAPAAQDRFGVGTITLSSTFNDPDQPGIGAFAVIFKLRAPYSSPIYTVADNYSNGQNGLSIIDNGGGSYTVSISYDPPENMELGYYDLYCEVSDGSLSGIDDYTNNLDELQITGSGENSSPVVPTDNTYPSPIAIERIGANPTTIYSSFVDADAPAVSVFKATFKVRYPDNSAEIILADNVANGAGVTIIDLGGGVYTASVSWDPPDGQILGVYDLYFHVNDGTDTTYDTYSNNLDELELYDAISNNTPTVSSGNTQAIANSVNRIGSDFVMLKSTFDDTDMPGKASFLVTFKVRDAGSAEYTVVDNSAHDQNGLRIRHVSGSTYEASVLWNPPDDQNIGDYDLYCFVDDQKGGTVTDDYTANSNELTITSSAILGDGNLLHRSNNSDNCGGPNSACHNLADHNGQTCVTCHTPHGSANIYMVKETITTPNSGDKPVLFKTLGTGDPYNSPDPIAGSDTHGAMADGSNTVYSEVCEVCHTTTKYYRNDGSQPSNHSQDVKNCKESCHTHSDGFSPGAGAESSGGISCSCHSNIFNAMDSTSLTYRHILANDDANYSPGASGMYVIKNCLTCHVDHDIFRNDLNPGIGQRAKNLRVDYDTDPVIGNSNHSTNSDYSSSGLGGICLSCHSGPSCAGCHSAHKSSYTHNFVPKSDFDASDAHNYNVPTTYSSDGSTFNANCTKCHNDNMTKSYQSSTFKVAFHSSDYIKLLDTNGVASPSDPIEEQFCFKCHSTTSNPNAGSNLDYFGVQSIPNPDALDIEEAFTRTFTHPTKLYSGRHSIADSALTLGDGNRHAECEDCHNPHAAQTGTHDGSSNLVSGALKGVWGVEPTSWPTPATPTDNANVFTAPSGYNKVEPATKEYQICLKCHSNYVTLPSGNRNLAEEINPNYPSTHAIIQAGDNPYCNTNTMNEPWGTYKINYCSDCHRSDNLADPSGPHGSNVEHMLVATIVSNSIDGTPLCFVCHQEMRYWSFRTLESNFIEHPATNGRHKFPQGCFACHMWDYSSTSGLGLNSIDWSGGTPPDGQIHVHGQNRQWVYNEQDGSAGSGQPVEGFVNGYMANMDYTAKKCWSEVCKSHSNKAY